MNQFFAPAKLNLFLHITGKRADGYHLLQSLAVFLSEYDIIEARHSNNLQLRVAGPQAPILKDQNNLALKAAELLQSYAGVQKGAHITLHKNLPVGAGLGGGSADAAATIRALSCLWGVALEPEVLHSLALQLGSDVPACLQATPCVVTGAGEYIRPVTLYSRLYFVLVNPGGALLTAHVYKAFKGAYRSESTIPPMIEDAELLRILDATSNSLEEAAISFMPVISDILVDIAAQDGCAVSRMSGSGATCFGVFLSENSAKAAMRRLQLIYPHAWIKIAALHKPQGAPYALPRM